LKISGLSADFSHSLSSDTTILKFPNADGEFLFGLGPFQDGYNNVVGLPRRLTQVNTQISVPVLISNKGDGIIWNNYAKNEGGWYDISHQKQPSTKKVNFKGKNLTVRFLIKKWQISPFHFQHYMGIRMQSLWLFYQNTMFYSI
jgi:hypothetical protein